MLLDPSWEIPVLSIPPGTSSRCQQCWEGKKRSHPSSLDWLQQGEQGSSSPFPALPGELRVSLHAPHRAADPKILQYYGKIKIKPKPVLLEQSWSQGLDKAQNFPSREMQRGPLPPLFPTNPGERQHQGNHPLPQLHPMAGAISLPASPSPPEQLQQQQAGLRGRGRGNRGHQDLWSTFGSTVRDYNREMQSLISRG